MQSDEGLEHLLEGTEPPALRAANFLAGLAVVAIEAPNRTRGVAVTMPAALGSRRPRSSTECSEGLSGNPLLKPVTLDQLFDQVPLATDDNDAPVTRDLAPISGAAPTVNPRRYKTTRSNLDAFSTIVGKDDGRIAAGERALLISLTSIWPGVRGREESRGRLDGVNAMIGGSRVRSRRRRRASRSRSRRARPSSR